MVIHVITWMNLSNMVRERSQAEKATYCIIPFIWNIQNQQIHRDRKLNEEWSLMSMMFLWGVIKMFYNHTVVILFCEYTKKHWIVNFKRMNFMIYKLYLNKGFFSNDCGQVPLAEEQTWRLVWILGSSSYINYQHNKVKLIVSMLALQQNISREYKWTETTLITKKAIKTYFVNVHQSKH